MKTEANNAGALVAKIAERVADARGNYESRKEWFLAAVAVNPANAVERASEVVLVQYEYEAWLKVEARASKWGAKSLCDDLHDDLLSAVGYGQSTNPFDNAAAGCKLRAMRNVYRDLLKLTQKYA